jgi:3-hydroxymyristoyl/3-hydroxydecanoyl-(acyl carrier protein) dehydratase
VTIVPDGRYFEGHFDNAPVLPGVVQIAMAVKACADRGLATRPLTGLRDIRFSRPLGPGDAIDVVLDNGRDPHSIRFEIRAAGQSAASGVLLFAAHDDGNQ